MSSERRNAARPFCPSRDELASYLRGDMPLGARETIGTHLSHCGDCGTLIRELGSGPAKPDDAASFEVDPPQLTSGGLSTPTATFAPAARPTRTLVVPCRMGQYWVVERIGMGGMGAVYRADHLHLKKSVAVKVLPQNRMADATAVARFQREMEVVGKLDHPNIVRATDAGEAEGIHFLVMDLIDGLNLAQLVRRCGPLPVPQACELIRQAALGLQHAHEHGLVHRDVKPQNLMLSARGEVKVLDLGLALLRGEHFTLDGLTGSGQVMGTADYMAPEQWEDCHWVDVRADLYSLGCTLYFLLTGRPPFDGANHGSAVRKMAAHVRDVAPPTQPNGAGLADPLLARLLAKDPADRPATPADLVRELTPLCIGADLIQLHQTATRVVDPTEDPTRKLFPVASSGQSTSAGAPATVTTERSRTRRSWRIGAATTTLLTAGTLAAIMSAGSGHRPEPNEPTQGVAAPPPGPTAPPTPELKTWEVLLKRPPGNRFWNPGVNGRWDHDPKSETLSIHAFQTGLLLLGEVGTRGYVLQIGFVQPQINDGIGFYFGGRPGKQPGHFRFQSIHLHLDVARGGNAVLLARSTGEILPTPGGGPGVSLHGFASQPLEGHQGSRELLLELEVKSRGRAAIRWNGNPCPNLTSAEINGRFEEIDYQGEFGIFCRGTSAVVTTARIMRTN